MRNLNFGQQYSKPLVVALGFFDSMHFGHMALVSRAKELAKACNCQAAIFTFSNNHFEVLSLPTKLIYTFDERLEIYNNVGIDVVLSTTFDRQFMSQAAKVFLDSLLQYDVKAVVCGVDYTCGSDRKSSKYVQEYLNNHNTICDIVQQVSIENQKISSTLIRQLLSQHKIQEANKLLSQNYFLCGTVVEGRKVGRQLGFPTANMRVSSDKLLVNGVYSCLCEVDGQTYCGMLNIGDKPTFGLEDVSIEMHLVGYNGNLYGRHLKIIVGKFLRDVVKFDSIDQMILQLQQDLQQVKDD